AFPCNGCCDGRRRLAGARRSRGSAARTPHGERLAGVLDGGIGRRLQRTGVVARAIDPAHADLAPGLHARVAALARADAQLATGFVPGQRNAAGLAALVAVVAAIVLVQREAAVGPGVDLDGEWRGR